MTKLRRPLAVRLAAALVALAVVYAAGWFVFAAQVRTAVEGWLEAQAGSPVRALCRDIAVSGFPGPVLVSCDQPRAVLHDWAWRGPVVRVQVVPWSLDRLPFSASGTHELEGPREGITLEAATMNGVIEPGSGGSISLTGATVSGPHPWSAETLTADVRFDTAADAQPVVAVAIEGKSLTVPEAIAAASQLGNRFEHIILEAVIRGQFPYAPWPPRALSLAQWRDNGGIIDIDRIRLQKGALLVDGDGTVALDNLLQPQAAFALKVSGYNELLNAFAARGLIAPRDAAMIGFVLGALSEVPAGGGPRRVTAPLTVQDNGIFIGPVRVGVLDPIRWPVDE